ncbi:hypothetical protein GCK32_017802 [Trichostrongylus colubriformis]|uniref:Uncharacterized protein n=1 Tax=Trichostrongylus colubriformis TaxID=6319 RepID=A0AAN8FUT4_TRICO
MQRRVFILILTGIFILELTGIALVNAEEECGKARHTIWAAYNHEPTRLLSHHALRV